VRAKQIFEGILAAAIRQPKRLDSLAAIETNRLNTKKGGLVTKSPFITGFVTVQKLNVMPVVAALIVAPPMVLLN
jgi:hypothetical protein